MSIIYSDVEFTEPIQLTVWNPPSRAGLYAILISAPRMKPKPFEVVYFGESEDMSERGFSSHHSRPCWINQAGSERNLWISVHLMPGSTKEERTNIESALVDRYNPSCNRV